MDEVVIAGDGLDKLKAVRFKKAALKFTLSDDKKSVTVSGLAAARVTSTPSEQTLEFEFEGGQKSTVSRHCEREGRDRRKDEKLSTGRE